MDMLLTPCCRTPSASRWPSAHQSSAGEAAGCGCPGGAASGGCSPRPLAGPGGGGGGGGGDDVSRASRDLPPPAPHRPGPP